jgi:predicted nuclease of restriction endonuclease-like (RecB) superfamily
MLFERTGLSRKPAELSEQELRALRDEDRLTPDLVFRDPYVLDFLGLHNSYSERELEAAILREIESFLLELGNGFAFIARQKRIRVDDEDFYIDLLLYHRKLRRIVAVDLKLEKFRPEHAGQMEFYLRWLAKHEQQPHEESPLGLILCSEKSQERIELMELGKSSIRVAEVPHRAPATRPAGEETARGDPSGAGADASGVATTTPNSMSKESIKLDRFWCKFL